MTKKKDSAEKAIRDIRRATRRQYSAEEKIRIVLGSGALFGAVAGYGSYERHGDELRIDVIRWTEANSDGASNVSGKTVIASFDRQVLTLDSGHRFKVRK